MIPLATFNAVRRRLGIPAKRIARYCLEMEMGTKPLTRKARWALARAWVADKRQRGYPTRHRRWDRLWAEHGGPAEMRTTVYLAAAALSRCGEETLSDWLLAARPEYLNEVATGVAAHALRRIPATIGPHPYDLLMDARLMREELALDLYENGDMPDRSLEWEPLALWLFG